MNVIIIDDEIANIENLQHLLQKHCKQVQVMATATTIHQAVGLIKMHRPDLVFLDIQMGRHNGFDLLKLLPDRTFEVIFITAYDQYGIQAVKFSALDYLLKPVDIDDLVAAVSKAEKRLLAVKNNGQLDFLLQYLKNPGLQNTRIALPQLQEIRYVFIRDIIRCEAENTYTFFFLENGEKILVSRPLKEYSDLLKPCGFLRTHQTHLVNPAFVKSWLKEDGGSLLMLNGEKIPVSKPNREQVKQALQ